MLHDDAFTLAGITAFGPGLGRQVREVLAGLFRDIMDKHGPRAFELPATFDELLARSRTIYAGIAAEALFAGEDRREGSSLDEVLLSQLFGRYAADLIGEEPEFFWQRNVHVWCLCQLGPCRDHRGVAPAQAGQRQAAAAAVRPGGARSLPGAGEQLAMASSQSWLQASGRSLLPT